MKHIESACKSIRDPGGAADDVLFDPGTNAVLGGCLCLKQNTIPNVRVANMPRISLHKPEFQGREMSCNILQHHCIQCIGNHVCHVFVLQVRFEKNPRHKPLFKTRRANLTAGSQESAAATAHNSVAVSHSSHCAVPPRAPPSGDSGFSPPFARHHHVAAIPAPQRGTPADSQRASAHRAACLAYWWKVLLCLGPPSCDAPRAVRVVDSAGTVNTKQGTNKSTNVGRSSTKPENSTAVSAWTPA